MSNFQLVTQYHDHPSTYFIMNHINRVNIWLSIEIQYIILP